MSKTKWQISIQAADNPKTINISQIAKAISDEIKRKEGNEKNGKSKV